MYDDSNGCSPPVLFGLFTLMALYGINSAPPAGADGRSIHMLMYASPLLVLLGFSVVPPLVRYCKESVERGRRHRERMEIEAETTRRQQQQNEEEQRRRAYQDEQAELRRQRELQLQQIREREEQQAAAENEERERAEELVKRRLKTARMECQRRYEILRHVLRSHFTEARFHKLVDAHLGDDCPPRQITANKKLLLELVDAMVELNTEGTGDKYHDVPSAIAYFQNEIAKALALPEVSEDDKEMIVTLIRRRKIKALDKMMGDDLDND